MYNNYGIEENTLTDMEVIEYAYSTDTIDNSRYHETILSIVEAYVDITGDVSLEYMDDYINSMDW